ncbi:MAG: RhuM family protein [Limisphaerales bacterium]
MPSFALAAGHQPSSPDCVKFFQIIQNKLHFAATGRTAAELVAARTDSRKPNMGLLAWKGATVRKADVTVAKNYLRQLRYCAFPPPGLPFQRCPMRSQCRFIVLCF